MGPKPSKQEASVIKPEAPTKLEEDSGWSLVEINLDSNGDGYGMTIWSILLISGATLLLLFALKRLKKCYANHVRRKKEKDARHFRIENLAGGRPNFDNDRFEEIIDMNIDINPAPRPVRPEAQVQAAQVPRPHIPHVVGPK